MEIGNALQETKNNSQAIEVEVLEVDGITVQPQPKMQEAPPQDAPWQHWQRQLTRLDSRWWPLWVLLGILAVGLLLTFGLVIGVVYLLFRILVGIGQFLFGG